MRPRWSRQLPLLLLVLVLALPSTARAATPEECEEWRTRWYELGIEIAQLQNDIRDDPRDGSGGDDGGGGGDTVSGGLGAASEALDPEELEDLEGKLEDLADRVGDDIEALEEFLSKAGEATGEAAERFEQAQAAVDKLKQVAEILEANRDDPAAAAQALSGTLALAGDLLEPLIGKVPGLGAFLTFYIEATSAIASAIARIDARLAAQSVALTGENVRDKRYAELQGLRNERNELWEKLQRECGDQYVYRGGGWLPVDVARAIDAEAAERQRKAAAAAAREAECEELKKQLAAAEAAAQEAGAEAGVAAVHGGRTEDPAAASGHAHTAGIGELEAKEAAAKAKALAEEIRRKCGPKAGDAADAQAGSAAAAAATAASYAQQAREAAEQARRAAAAKAAWEECVEECEDCEEAVEKLKQDIANNQAQQDANSAARDAARADQANAEADAQDALEDAKQLVFETPTGAIVLGAPGSGGPGLTYKGFVVAPQDMGAVRAARAAAAAAKARADALEAQGDALADEAERLHDALRDKREECEECRQRCLRLRAVYDQARSGVGGAGQTTVGPFPGEGGAGGGGVWMRRPPGGGDPVGRRVRLSTRTRWEEVKGVLRSLTRAYVNQDLLGFMREVGDGLVQDTAVLRNALQEDFQNQTAFQVDLELTGYQLGFDRVSVQLRWNRNATDMASGTPRVSSGTSRLVFSRGPEGYALSSWTGDTPFGVTDPAWVEQVRGGQPRVGGGPGGPGGPAVQTLMFTLNPAGNQFALLDLEGGAVSLSPAPGVPSPADDIQIQLGGPAYQVTQLPGGPPNVTGFCTDDLTVPMLVDLRQANSALGPFAAPGDPGRVNYFTVLSPAGVPSFLAISLAGAAGDIDFTVDYLVGQPGDTVIHPAGTFDCP